MYISTTIQWAATYMETNSKSRNWMIMHITDEQAHIWMTLEHIIRMWFPSLSNPCLRALCAAIRVQGFSSELGCHLQMREPAMLKEYLFIFFCINEFSSTFEEVLQGHISNIAFSSHQFLHSLLRPFSLQVSGLYYLEL